MSKSPQTLSLNWHNCQENPLSEGTQEYPIRPTSSIPTPSQLGYVLGRLSPLQKSLRESKEHSDFRTVCSPGDWAKR